MGAYLDTAYEEDGTSIECDGLVESDDGVPL